MRNAFIYIPFSVIALAVDLRVILMLPAIIGNSFFSDWSLHLSLLPIYIFDFQSICHRMAHVIVNTPCFGKTIVKNNYRHCTVL